MPGTPRRKPSLALTFKNRGYGALAWAGSAGKSSSEEIFPFCYDLFLGWVIQLQIFGPQTGYLQRDAHLDNPGDVRAGLDYVSDFLS